MDFRTFYQIEYEGRSFTVTEFAQFCGVSYEKVRKLHYRRGLNRQEIVERIQKEQL